MQPARAMHLDRIAPVAAGVSATCLACLMMAGIYLACRMVIAQFLPRETPQASLFSGPGGSVP
jgi:hypothetical protein